MCDSSNKDIAPQRGYEATGRTERAGTHPLALVYRGPAGCDGCSEAVARLLQSSQWGFDVKYVGPNEPLKLKAATLKSAVLYAQPGGGQSLSRAYRWLKNSASDIRNFVNTGGLYLGICMGGYLAGATPGFHLLPGDTDEFITSRGAGVRTSADTIVKVNWRDQPRWMYFQDGPYFILNSGATGVTVLATYTNGKIAALVTPYGKGKVGVVGTHPEADASWYADSRLVDPDGPDEKLGHDLIDMLMQ